MPGATRVARGKGGRTVEAVCPNGVPSSFCEVDGTSVLYQPADERGGLHLWNAKHPRAKNQPYLITVCPQCHLDGLLGVLAHMGTTDY